MHSHLLQRHVKLRRVLSTIDSIRTLFILESIFRSQSKSISHHNAILLDKPSAVACYPEDCPRLSPFSQNCSVNRKADLPLHLRGFRRSSRIPRPSSARFCLSHFTDDISPWKLLVEWMLLNFLWAVCFRVKSIPLSAIPRPSALSTFLAAPRRSLTSLAV